MTARTAFLIAVALTSLPGPVVLCARGLAQANGSQQEAKTAKNATEHAGPDESADAAAGKRVFELHCTVCHGLEGKGGGRGPNLNRAHLERAADDAALKSVIEKGIPPEMPGGWYLSAKDLARLVAYVRSLGRMLPERLPGDAAQGARVYAKGGCASCHIVAGEGTGFGPELTEIGTRRSAQYLEKCLVKPSANLPEGFLLVEERTAAGETVRGIRVNEDTFSIQIKDSAGRFHSLRKQELKELRKLQGESPMPSYEQIFSAAELQDLVAYLASLRGKP